MNYGTDWPSTHISLLNRVRVPTDTEAWKEFVSIYGPLIFNYCRKCQLNNCDSEDVCQEVFRRISTSFHSFEYNRNIGKFRSWLGTVTYHEICRCFKKNQRFINQRGAEGTQEILYEQPGESDAVWSDVFCSHIYQTAINNVRTEFNEKTWKAFERTWIENKPPKEVAAELAVEISWVYKAKFHVQKKLKDEIQRLSFDSIVFQK